MSDATTTRLQRVGPLEPDTVRRMLGSLATMTVGLLRLTREPERENGFPVGTATLVSIDGVEGLLTAAHVLEALPKTGAVGLVRFTSSEVAQRLKIEFGLGDPLIVGRPPFDDNLGPDIAFVRLPAPSASSLAATNAFFNLSKRPPGSIKYPVGKQFVEVLVGVIAERTNVQMDTPRLMVKGVIAGAWSGEIVNQRNQAGFELIDFGLVADDRDEMPTSFGGTSGGGLWRITVDESGSTVLDKTLIGVAFWESGVRPPVITCQGLQSAYPELCKMMARREF